MWSEGLRRGQFESQDFLSSVGVLHAALITVGHKKVRHRRRCHGIGLAERDLVPGVQIRVTVKLDVLADYYPIVAGLIPRAPSGHSWALS
jgi:hypothetical protein